MDLPICTYGHTGFGRRVGTIRGSGSFCFNFILFSKIDTELGHFRRYTISDLTAKMQTAGFEIQDARYCDSMGFLAWFSVKILKIGQKMDRRVSLGMKIFDKLILPFSIKIDQVFPRIPFGKNLLIIGIKKEVLPK
jgi:hypothetical protein